LVTIPQEQLDSAAHDVIELLQNQDRRRQAVEKNYTSAQALYSYDALENIIRTLLHDHAIVSPA